MRVQARRFERDGGDSDDRFEDKRYEIAAGAETQVGQGWSLGGGIAYERPDMETGDYADTDGHQAQVGIAARRESGPWVLGAGLSAGLAWLDVERDVGTGAEADGDQDLAFLTGRVRAGYRVALAGLAGRAPGRPRRHGDQHRRCRRGRGRCRRPGGERPQRGLLQPAPGAGGEPGLRHRRGLAAHADGKRGHDPVPHRQHAHGAGTVRRHRCQLHLRGRHGPHLSRPRAGRGSGEPGRGHLAGHRLQPAWRRHRALRRLARPLRLPSREHRPCAGSPCSQPWPCCPQPRPCR